MYRYFFIIKIIFQATELDKARAVGKRALETINMTLTKEKFNVWMALLNLENMYGNKVSSNFFICRLAMGKKSCLFQESFENLFQEAVKCNDSLELYLSVIKMLANCGKLDEMEEKIKRIRSKEKRSIKMWLEIGQVYYNLQKYREARNIKEAALRSILEKKKR